MQKLSDTDSTVSFKFGPSKDYQIQQLQLIVKKEYKCMFFLKRVSALLNFLHVLPITHPNAIHIKYQKPSNQCNLIKYTNY